MKKKIDIEDTKTKVIILIISIVLIIIIVSVTSYYFISKWGAPISNESKEETEFIDEIKTPDNMLYHIVYLENNITYDILIDENYNISMASKSDTNESLLNEKHTQIDFFDNKQKEWLINYLNNLEYPYNLVGEIELENYNYAISNYQIEKGLANIEYENYLLDIIIYSLVTENATYYDYFMRDNNVTNYISDTNYQELDVNDEKVINLYSKIVPSYTLEVKTNGDIYESYKTGIITNDTIISITYNNMEFETINQNCLYDFQETYSNICYIDNIYFDETLKSIFGNVTYNIAEFQGYENNNGDFIEYDTENNQLKVNIWEGATPDSFFYSDIALAYETNNKIVIIEKNLYYAIDGEVEEGLYESIDKKILIPTLNIGMNNNEEALNELEPFVTYYAHTFTLSDDGNYYYTDIDRLN